LKTDYEVLTDEELVSLYHEGDTQVAEYIMMKYKNLVRKSAESLFILGGDNQDLVQEGMIGLYKAVRDFKPEKGASFYTFAEMCVSKNIYTAIQKSNRKKHIPLNSYVSIYGDDNETVQHQELGNDTANPENIIIGKENREMLEDAIEKELSGLEQDVLKYRRIGMSYKEIARVLEREEKVIDNAMQRIRNKLKGYLSYVM